MSTKPNDLEELIKRLKRAREHPELDDKGGYVPGTLTRDEAAQRGYEWWKFRGFRKVATPEGILSDAKEAQKDLIRDPIGFPHKFKRRVEGYSFQGGPDINEPAYTYPSAEVTPYKAEGDLIRAQRAVTNRSTEPVRSGNVPKRQRRKRSVRY